MEIDLHIEIVEGPSGRGLWNVRECLADKRVTVAHGMEVSTGEAVAKAAGFCHRYIERVADIRKKLSEELEGPSSAEIAGAGSYKRFRDIVDEALR